MKHLTLPSVLLALTLLSITSAFAAGADPVVSRWNWGGPSVVQIWSNGRAHWQMGAMTMDGQWTLASHGSAGHERKYVITWNGGQWIDSVTMSPDHQHLYGRNQVGFPVNGIRIGGETASEEETATAGAEIQPARRKAAIGKTKPVESSTEETAETPASTPPSPAEKALVGSGTPKKAAVIIPPGEDYLQMGDIKVTYADGHTEMWTQGALCGDPHVSSAGDVGWVHSTKSDDRYTHRTPDMLHVHLHGGETRELKPNDPFIETWVFAGNNSEIIIKSRQHHGPAAYIKYDLKTGRETGRIDEYLDESKMPKWAKPFAD